MRKRELLEFMAHREYACREDIIERFGDRYEVPPYEKLAESYIASKIAQDLASARDEEGMRCILARRGRGGTQYVNVGRCRNVLALKHIKGRIQNDIAGQKLSLKKVDLRLEQLSFFKGIIPKGIMPEGGGDAA